jgi:hypothetical protein
MGGRKLVTYTLTTESGAAVRGAGFRVVAQVRPQPWNHAKRQRAEHPVHKLAKQRWELTA